MIIDKTDDMAAVGRILNHPKVYRMVTDDSSPDQCTPDPEGFYVMNDAKTGVVRVDPLNGSSAMVHIATHPVLWGGARSFCMAAIEWFFLYTRYVKLVAHVPEFNRLTIKLCSDIGFKREGLLTKSFTKNWKHHDQVVFGLTKPEFIERRALWQ